jgi:N-acetyl-anhydromuramyl-L-alanine amidase AmpD
MAWNTLVPASRRIASLAQTIGRPVAKPTHVVCHITGTNSLNSVKAEFKSTVSAHYLVDKSGLIYQFVEEENQAWHAGIKKAVHPLYAEPPSTWQKYLYYFDWDSYPAGSVFLDRDLEPVQGGNMATFVARPDGTSWSKYDYFKNRWGAGAGPVNYDAGKSPNAYSVGIEILSVGAKSASATAYTDAMYTSLRTLVTDICTRHAIPQEKGRVVGHEDVNPVQRYGWDPNQGFDWSKVWT